jgi:hypothetical protein
MPCEIFALGRITARAARRVGFGTSKAHKCSRVGRLFGSEQEFDKKPILCGFPEKHEFGLGDSHTLSLEEQVA